MSRWNPKIRGATLCGTLRSTVLVSGILALSACSDMTMPDFLQPKAQTESGDAVSRSGGGFGADETIERDVEAPEIFQATEAGLWDGRPSLGGVWVAHPDVAEPGRVIIRNEKNGQFVIGALFRRERQSPGPRLQVSSDAAAAIGMLAGAPTNLDVVALKREELAPIPEPEALSEAPADSLAEPGSMPAAPEVAEGTLDPVVSGAAAAIETASLAPAPNAVRPPAAIRDTTAQSAAATAPAPKTSKLAKPFIQIGIFSVEQNALNTATAMRQAGMVPTVKKQSSKGKTFWRVVVGPAQDKTEMSALLKKIKGTGFTDAYAVTH